jgi:hypothetical protein
LAPRLGHSRDQVLSSRSLSLSSRDHGASTTAPGHHFNCRPSMLPGTDSLRLSLPSTHSGIRSLLNQGLPRPVGSTFRVFVYPLSGFFLLNPLAPFFRPKRSWDSPLQSFPPFEEPCFSRSLLLSFPFAHRIRPCITIAPGLQGVAPFKEPSSRIDHYTNSGAVTLLGFSSSGVFHLSDPGLSRDSPSFALSPASEEAGAVP